MPCMMVIRYVYAMGPSFLTPPPTKKTFLLLIPLTITVTSAARICLESSSVMFFSASAGVNPATRTSLISGIEIMPSGRTPLLGTDAPGSDRDLLGEQLGDVFCGFGRGQPRHANVFDQRHRNHAVGTHHAARDRCTRFTPTRALQNIAFADSILVGNAPSWSRGLHAARMIGLGATCVPRLNVCRRCGCGRRLRWLLVHDGSLGRHRHRGSRCWRISLRSRGFWRRA